MLRDVALVAYPGAQSSAVAGLADLFAVANTVARASPGREVTPLRVTIMGDALPRYPVPAVIVIPPTLIGPPAPEAIADLLDWLRACHARGSTVAGICAGVFVLAATGLLDHRPATTHWQAAARLQASYPALRIDPDRLLVDDGDILTSAGVMSWPDIGLRLVDRLLGPEVMAGTARYLLVDPPRHDQRHYRQFDPPLAHGDRAITKVQHWLRTRSAQMAGVAEMVRVSGLGERTFLRRFRRATGLAPSTYVQHLRTERGRDLLETTTLPLSRIAWETGYQDTGAFSRRFTCLTGLSPAEYRRRFVASTASQRR